MGDCPGQMAQHKKKISDQPSECITLPVWEPSASVWKEVILMIPQTALGSLHGIKKLDKCSQSSPPPPPPPTSPLSSPLQTQSRRKMTRTDLKVIHDAQRLGKPLEFILRVVLDSNLFLLGFLSVDSFCGAKQRGAVHLLHKVSVVALLKLPTDMRH